MTFQDGPSQYTGVVRLARPFAFAIDSPTNAASLRILFWWSVRANGLPFSIPNRRKDRHEEADPLGYDLSVEELVQPLPERHPTRRPPVVLRVRHRERVRRRIGPILVCVASHLGLDGPVFPRFTVAKMYGVVSLAVRMPRFSSAVAALTSSPSRTFSTSFMKYWKFASDAIGIPHRYA